MPEATVDIVRVLVLSMVLVVLVMVLLTRVLKLVVADAHLHKTPMTRTIHHGSVATLSEHAW